MKTLRAWAAAGLLAAAGTATAVVPPVSDEAALAGLQSAYERSVTPGEEAGRYRELLATVLQRAKRSSVAGVDLAALAASAAKAIEPLPAGEGEPVAVFRKAIHAALSPVDPYARYVDAQAYGDGQGELSGAFGGLGLEVEAAGGGVRVVAPMPGGPGARAGLATGDVILRVDEQPLAGVPLADAIARMRGQPGTPVSLLVRRAATGDERTLSLTRETIRRQTVRAAMEGDVLVLRLAMFSSTSHAALEQAIAAATAERRPSALVLDLRGNPGGLLHEAVKIADAFLGAGEIVSIRSPARRRAWQADPSELLAGVPMVVLVDRRSASASELVADALQAHGRATVMGQRSFGKGSVQSTFALGEGNGAIRLTTFLYHGPSGETLHRVGVGPDVELVAASGTEPSREPVPARSPRARVESARCADVAAADPVLSCALAYLKAGNVDAFVAGLPAAAP